MVLSPKFLPAPPDLIRVSAVRCTRFSSRSAFIRITRLSAALPQLQPALRSINVSTAKKELSSQTSETVLSAEDRHGKHSTCPLWIRSESSGQRISAEDFRYYLIFSIISTVWADRHTEKQWHIICLLASVQA
ncbi:hypothetical protein SDC9_167649 [bioreactor metagenome]|uniref:Uncharacterized protein n=1 Tax=bioreactor metagenome TaxID=1076179 RepID=A0A645G0D1_9ZZZZ